jgi:hypothetical protein
MVIQKSKVSKEDSKNYGEESTRTIGYFHTVPQAYKCLVDQEILESDATSIKELIDEIKLFKSEIMEHLSGLEEMRNYSKLKMVN